MSRGHISSMLAAGLLTLACGGSASETPPPLEPDLRLVPKGAPASGRYVVITPRTRGSDAKEGEQGAEGTGEAPSTWGDADAAE